MRLIQLRTTASRANRGNSVWKEYTTSGLPDRYDRPGSGSTAVTVLRNKRYGWGRFSSVASSTISILCG
jgi:hypothetical protein